MVHHDDRIRPTSTESVVPHRLLAGVNRHSRNICFKVEFLFLTAAEAAACKNVCTTTLNRAFHPLVCHSTGQPTYAHISPGLLS